MIFVTQSVCLSTARAEYPVCGAPSAVIDITVASMVTDSVCGLSVLGLAGMHICSLAL